MKGAFQSLKEIRSALSQCVKHRREDTEIEMALGDTEINGRADLHSLGCTAHWLLTGFQVFEADTPIGLALHHVQTEPPRVSERTGIEIPGQLVELVHTCLAKDPAAHPQSASNLAGQLSVIHLREPRTHERAESWWHTHLPESVIVPPANSVDS